MISTNYIWRYAKETYPNFYERGLLEQELETIEADIVADNDYTAEELKEEIEERVDNAYCLVSEFVSQFTDEI